MKLKDKPKLTSFGNYTIDCDFSFLSDTIKRYTERYNLQINPDFQRGHVWTQDQQISFCEFIISGGKTSPILFNCVGWGDSGKEMVCVDGLQRLTAIFKLINNELKVYGHYLNEYEDSKGFLLTTGIKLNINNLNTRKEVLKWYLELNGGGTPHTQDELERVKKLYDEELK